MPWEKRCCLWSGIKDNIVLGRGKGGAMALLWGLFHLLSTLSGAPDNTENSAPVQRLQVLQPAGNFARR